MKFSEEKKKTIMLYLLDKIDKKADNISKCVSEAFEVNQNTIHTYINQLAKNNIIKRVKRGEYELISDYYSYNLKRSKGELDSDIDAYNACLKKHIEGLDKNVRDIWAYAVCEMINNVMDHSEAENLSVYVMQNYLKTTVVIEDDGVGIFEKIKKYFDFSTLEEAICELFKGKLTTDSERHSGEGIFFTSKLMDEFAILSSEKIFAVNKFDKSGLLDLGNSSHDGTFVFMSLSNYSHKQSYEVFDMYSDVDDRFVKTVIPLKNIFDASPVSRSQARRICNRLDEFEEIELDFSGVDWMGQGFAHEIFVVFAKKHPDIKLTPLNMSEAVMKMYRHVKGDGEV